jgi:hypothetical protein
MNKTVTTQKGQTRVHGRQENSSCPYNFQKLFVILQRQKTTKLGQRRATSDAFVYTFPKTGLALHDKTRFLPNKNRGATTYIQISTYTHSTPSHTHSLTHTPCRTPSALVSRSWGRLPSRMAPGAGPRSCAVYNVPCLSAISSLCL